MLIIISPAKNLNFKPQSVLKEYTIPVFTERSAKLVDILRKKSPLEIARLMHISQDLADLNFQRYLQWNLPFTNQNAKQALLAFNGEVYNGLKASSFESEDFYFAQDHMRILSGLYGVLRPLDLIQSYRLEMGCKLVNPNGKDLYQFWGELVTQTLNEVLKEDKIPVLINLASAEYFKSIKPKKLKARIIHIEFLENKNNQYKTIVVYTKKARGMVSRFVIKNKLSDPEDLKAFDCDGYIYNERLSSSDNWIFTRR